MVWCAVPHERAQLFVELVATARDVDDDDLARLVRQVEERMRDAWREVGEATFREVERLVADLDPVSALESVDRLLLVVVDVERRPALGATSTMK
jgi:hypothetical protein